MNVIEIEKEIYWRWQKCKQKVLAKDDEWDKRLHVTEIVYDCLRPPVFRLAYGIKDNPVGKDKDSFYTVWLGTCVHKVNALGDKTEIPVSYGILYGQIDDLVKIGDEWVIVDKKTTRQNDLWRKTEASSHHVNQINYYNFLLMKTMGIVAKYGAVIYTNPCSGDENIIGFEMRPVADVGKEITEKVKMIETCVKEKRMPNRVKSWYCSYCPYWEMCIKTD